MKANGGLYCTDCEKDLAVDFCHDCKLRLCDSCSSYHLRSTRLIGHTMENINYVSIGTLLQPTEVTCAKHKQVLKYFCDTCKLPCCNDCTLSKHHQTHAFRLLEETIEEDMESLKLFIPFAKQQKEEYDAYLKKAKKYLETAAKCKEESTKVVEETFQGIFDILETEKKNLLAWLDKGYETSRISFSKAHDDASILGLTVKYLEDMSKNCPKEKVSQLVNEGNKRLKGFVPNHILGFALCSRKIENTSYVETIKTAMTQISFLKNLVPHPIKFQQVHPTNSLYSQELPSMGSLVGQQMLLPCEYNGPQIPSNYFGASMHQSIPHMRTHQSQPSLKAATKLPDGKYLPENIYLPSAFTYKETQFQI